MRKLVSFIFAILLFWSTAFADIDIYFLDVGQGDAAVIVCDGELMMIDGGNPGDSQFIYSFLRNTLCVDHMKLMVATHPHDDHIGGLPATLNAVEVETILSPVRDYDSKRFSSLLKYAPQGVVVPDLGDTFQLGNALITVLGPATTSYENINDWSIVLRIDYGNTSFLFTGDASEVAESDMLASGEDLDSDVLKVGHHGSSSSSTSSFLKAVSPAYAIISVGSGNSYGHPSEETIDRLASIGARIYRTDLNGTIKCHSDGQEITFETERILQPEQTSETSAEAIDDSASQSEEYSYVGNMNSHKFHYPDCQSVSQMKEKNKCFFTSRDEAVGQGYVPCKNCNP